MKITKAQNLTADDLAFGDIRKNDLGGKFIPLKYSTGEKMYVQMPALRTPFGLSSMTDQTSGKTSYTVPLSFDLNDPKAQELVKVIEALDEKVVQHVHANCKALMGKQHKIDILREGLYRPILTASKDPEKYGPTLKLKVLQDRNTGTFVPEAFNNHKQPVDLDSLERGGTAESIVEFVHAYVIDGRIGVSVRLSQIKMSASNKLSGYAFQDDDEEETREQTLMEDEMDDLA